MFAPPARADSNPNKMRLIREPETMDVMRCGCGARAATNRGTKAPEAKLKAAAHVDVGELPAIADKVDFQFRALLGQRGRLGIGLRMDGYVLAGGHGHGACDQGRESADQHIGMAGTGGGDAEHQARSGDDAVVRAEHGGAQPTDAAQGVVLMTAWTHG
jgi:hypothetical protein